MVSRKLIFFSITSLGISHIVTQLVLIREFLNVFSGSEVVVGVILANWLLLMGLGSYLGKFLRGVKDKIRFLVFSQVFVALIPFLLIFLVRYMKANFFLYGEALALFPMFLSSFLILLPYSIVSGLLLTLACSVFPSKEREAKIGYVYFMDNIGDILGGLLFSFVLVYLFDPFQMAFLVMLLNLSAALLLSLPKKYFLFPLSAALLLSLLFFSLDFENITLQLMFPGQEVIHHETSPYGNVVVTKAGRQLNFFENGAPLFSTLNTISNEETVHYAMVQHPNPKRVLLLSGGVAGTVKEIEKYAPEKIDYVELDPLILKLGKLYTSNLNFSNLNVINQDARFFVKHANESYDVVLIDLPDPETMQVNRFYTLEFFKELKRITKRDSVISLSLSSSENYMNPETAKMNSVLYNTLKKTFRYVIIIPGDENFFLASDSPLTYNITQKLKEKGIKTSYIEFYSQGKITPERINSVMRAISSSEINTDFTPILSYYYFKYWASQFRSAFLSVFLIALVIVFGVFLMKYGATPFSIFTTGFAGAGLEMVLLFSFQILFGYVYQYVGVVVAFFMLGIALGSFYSTKTLKKRTKKTFITIEFAIFLYSLLLPGILIFLSTPTVNHEIVFPILTLAIAFLVGSEFPIAGKLYMKESVEKTAGVLYASDLFGSCLGAVLVTTILIPLLGLLNTCFLIGLLNLISGIILWIR
ncbi:MAG TPA: hypothetical protein ENF95_01750 [Candidatus Aenigmarchaeota archaeon]|nr:hypothetical protein [Candidatus Aenigmarchaeota archaeon]